MEVVDMFNDRVHEQMKFIVEIDKLKDIYRKTKLIESDRYENDAEHSWQLAVMAILLEEHANSAVNMTRVIKMLLIHDLVEIDAGDTFVYDEAGRASKEQREKQGAERIFGLLPEDQEQEFWNLWREFEEEQTPEAQFAVSLDRMQPILHNYFNQGGTWQEYKITRSQVEEKNGRIVNGSKTLWEYTNHILDLAEEQGFLNSDA